MLRSVKSQITLAISIIIILILGLTAYLVIDQKAREINQDIFNKAVSFAELTHERVVDGFENNYQEGAFANFERELAEIYSLNEDISTLAIYAYSGDSSYQDNRGVSEIVELDRIQAVFPSVKVAGSERVVYLEKTDDRLRYTNLNGASVDPISDQEQILNVVYPFRDPNNIARSYSINYEVSYDALQERIEETMMQILMIALVGLLVSLVIAYVLAHRITAPIKALSRGAHQIGQGDLKTRIPIKTKTEVGMLADTFNKMAKDLEKSTHAMIEHEKTAKELELATEIQQDLLPKNLPKIPHLDIAASLNAATEVGGDCYDFIPMEKKGDLLFYVADVTGHGVGAGLVSAINNALVPALMDHFNKTRDLVLNLNKTLRKKTSAKIFVTTVMARWNAASKTLHFTQAGHDPILHYSAKKKKVASLAHGGMPLGMVDDLSKVTKTEEVTPGEGDVFVLYTDGIPEAWKNDKESYGMDRLKKAIEKYSSLPTAQKIHDALLKDVKDFMGSYPQADDITLLVVKRTK